MTQETTPADRLDEWEKLASAATPGPWGFKICAVTGTCGFIADGDHDETEVFIEAFPDIQFAGEGDEAQAKANAAFIAAAREAIPALIEMVREKDRRLTDTICLLSEACRGRGEAEGKLMASEVAGAVAGWQSRATAAEARVKELETTVAHLRAALNGDFS